MTRPALPTLRALTARLRELRGLDGLQRQVCVVKDRRGSDCDWTLWIGSAYSQPCAGHEYIPGNGDPFDAVAAARRLLAAARDHEDTNRD